MSARADEPPVLDIVGVGFGPANLALAIALAEQERGRPPLSARFLERQPRFGWHRGMLLEDATMQVSFLKDLVTLRNPASEFSFLCYLHSRGRLVDFINHKCLFPSRVEFHDYLQWAAAKVSGYAEYGREVTAVRPVFRDGELELFEVAARDAGGAGRPAVRRARNLVLGVGLEPYLPPGITIDARVWHNRDLLPNVERMASASPSRFVVVGAGQSAAEAVDHLHRRFPRAEVCAVFARYGYSPADDSSFANRIFDPAAVDDFYAAPPHVKQLLLDYHGNTNYSVVDQDLIDDLYRRVYQERVRGERRLRMLNVSRLVETVRTPDAVRVVVESMITGERSVLDADAVVFATGYRPADPLRLLGDAAGLCLRDEAGRPRVARDYRVETEPQVTAGIYLQGATEHTHGLSSSLLSNMAVRSAEILRSVADRSASDRSAADRSAAVPGTVPSAAPAAPALR